MSRKRCLDFLFQTHNKALLAFAGQQSGYDSAEDLVQDAYVRLLQHPDPETIENPRAFLYKTTLNLSIDQHRRQSTRDRFHSDGSGIAQEIVLLGQMPEDHLAAQQTLGQFNALLMELPELTRFAFVLYRLEGFSHQDVAKRLGISVRSSERRVAQAANHILSHFDVPA